MEKREEMLPLRRPIDHLCKVKNKWDEDYEDHLRQELFKDDHEDKDDSIDDAEYQRTLWKHHERPGEKWDVPKKEKIEYFDTELSYELTGYRPITLDKGLDFDPAPFQEAGRTYLEKGRYTEYPPGTKPWKEYWKEQIRRCQEGYTVGKYRITADHYFFLNFYRMLTIVEGRQVGEGREESFPSFSAAQYEWYHYVEMAEILKQDCVALKGRGVGWSEIGADLAVRPYTTQRGYQVLLCCAAETKLNPLRDKCWTQLNFLDMCTEGALKHLRQVKNSYEVKRASQLTPSGEEYGWKSEIRSVVSDNPQKIRGARCDRLILDEAGSDRNLVKSWIQGDSLVNLGGIKMGSKFAFGTGGDDLALGGLSEMFYSPAAFGVLPFKNYFTDDEKPALTAFFLPSHKFSLDPHYVDSRGVTNHIEFKKVYEGIRKKLTSRALVDECAEHCFTPREALIKNSSALFDSTALSQRLMQLKVGKKGAPIKHMQLLWDKTVGDGMERVQAFERKESKLLVVEPPCVDESGRPFKNLYVAGIDSIDMGTKDSASYTDVSDYCIVVYKRVFGMEEPKIVAMYKDRPRDIREAYDLSIKLLTWYNCQAMLEYTRISIIQYFTERKKEKLFMARPAFAITGGGGRRRGQKTLIGVPSTPAVINHGLELVGNFIDDYWHTIDFDEVCEQLINYTIEEKRKFDIVAALQMCMIGDEAMTGTTVRQQADPVKNEWKNFGYYKDENGYTRYGVIPKHY